MNPISGISKSSLVKFIAIIAMFALFFHSGTVLAAWNGNPYAPGQTLDPECAPTDPDCTVDTSSSSTPAITYTASELGIHLDALSNIFSLVLDGNSLSVASSGLRISPTYAGQASITTLGTVASGTWQGAPIAAQYGGTGITSTPTNGQVLVGNGTGFFLANITGTNGVAVSNGTGTLSIGLNFSGVPSTSTISTQDLMVVYDPLTESMKTIEKGDLFSSSIAGVSDVFGRTGSVTAAYGDYSAALISNAATGTISATNMQDAINELASEMPSTASTSQWSASSASTSLFNAFYVTPSSRITAGTNLSWNGNTLNATFSTSSLGLTTDNVAEGSANLYFTNGRADARADARLAASTSTVRSMFSSASSSVAYNASTGQFTLSTAGDWGGTFDGQEGSHYLNRANQTGTQAWSTVTSTPTSIAGYGITDAQASDSDLTALAGLSGTGIAVRTGTGTWATLATSSLGINADSLVEGSANLFFTNSRADARANAQIAAATSTVRGMISAAGPLAYDTSTGIMSLSSGYVLPLTASTTQWNQAYASTTLFSAFYTNPSSRITAGTNLAWNGNTLNASIADASLSVSGVVSTSTQSFAGDKTFSGSVAVGGTTSLATTTITNLTVQSFNPVNFSFTNSTSTNLTVTGNLNANSMTLGSSTGLVYATNGVLGSIATSSLGLTTDNIAEGSTNLFFTNGRADARADIRIGAATSTLRNMLSISATGLSYSTTTGAVSLAAGYAIPLTASTTEWAASSASSSLFNAFYANPSTRISAGTGVSWVGNTLSNTGVLSVGSLTGNVSTSTLGINTDTLVEGSSNIFFTNTRADARANLQIGASTSTVRNFLSAAGPITYSAGTGQFGLSAGFDIPLAASTTQWSSFYNTPSTRISLGTGLNWAGNSIGVSTSSLGITGTRWALSGNDISYAAARVSVGTTTASKAFTVASSTDASVNIVGTGASIELWKDLTINRGVRMTQDTSGNMSLGTWNGPQWRDAFTMANGAPANSMIINSSGGVRIAGLSTCTLGIGVNGSGDIVCVLSDGRLKDIQQEYTGGLDAIDQLKPVVYTWNEASGRKGEAPVMGFIAQDVGAAIPEALATTSGGYYTYNHLGILGAAVNAIKELKKQFGDFASAISQRFVTKEVQTDKLCVGTTCITEAELKSFLSEKTSGTSQLPLQEVVQVVPEAAVVPKEQENDSETQEPADQQQDDADSAFGDEGSAKADPATLPPAQEAPPVEPVAHSDNQPVQPFE